MNYTNLEIYKELKRINKCHENQSDMDELRKDIYNNKKSQWLLNFLEKNEYIKLNRINDMDLYYLIPKWNDFININKINYIIKDYNSFIIWIIWLFTTIIVSVIIYILTKN